MLRRHESGRAKDGVPGAGAARRRRSASARRRRRAWWSAWVALFIDGTGNEPWVGIDRSLQRILLDLTMQEAGRSRGRNI